MKIKKILMVLGCAALLCGCTKSQIVNPEEGTRVVDKPDMETKADVQLDWEQIGTGLDEVFTDEEAYPMCGGEDAVNFDLDLENKIFNLNLFVKAGTSKQDAVTYATEVAKGVNDEVATQDFSYERSGADSLGGYFKEYTLKVTVIAGTPMSSDDKYLVEDTIPAGEDKAIQAK